MDPLDESTLLRNATSCLAEIVGEAYAKVILLRVKEVDRRVSLDAVGSGTRARTGKANH